MTLSITPDLVTDAAGSLSRIGDMVSEATGSAHAATTAILPAGTDEVSAALTELFNGHGLGFQSIAAQAETFHAQFVQNLSHAATDYSATDVNAGQVLRDAVTKVEQLFVKVKTVPTTPPTVPSNSPVGIYVGGTTNPFPTDTFPFVKAMYNLPQISSVLFTPEQLWPATPFLGGLSLNQSVAQGASLLHGEILTQWASGNDVTVFGVSQGALVETAAIQQLMAAGSPNVANLHFILAGDPANPNGGFFARFPFQWNVPILDAHLGTITPPNSQYQTTIYTNQYDPVSNFPQNPLNVISDANSLIGWTQHSYTTVPGRIYIPEPTSPGYTGNTTYLINLDNQLPLLNPIRNIPAIGTPIADLLQPDLRVIADMGYGEGYANVPTHFSLPQHTNWGVVTHDLATGAQQGVDAAGVDLGLLGPQYFPNAYPYLPVLDPGLH